MPWAQVSTRISLLDSARIGRGKLMLQNLWRQSYEVNSLYINALVFHVY